ncbi:sugar kinase [Oceaniglobus roseus]|uniref:sugar kinase n=1 Tax=Oceaniglobus roseus TaxID=1737570 RepID=UPI000C7EF257|nr:sugar kinase [Kandeliimicrobium roseum]
MKRFVSVGECMVELAPSSEAGLYAMAFSGDTFNTAWYARGVLPADWTVDYVTAVGCDGVSGRMLDFARDSGIGTGHVARIEGRTLGLYLIELKEGERSFVYWREQSAARLLAEDPARLAAAFSGADVVYFSGITLAVIGAEGRSNLLSEVRRARAAGALAVFDPNLRPRLWPDTEAMCAAVMEAAAVCDIALPSFDDEAQHFGDADPEATASRYAGAGASMVAVKNGGGAVLVRGRLGDSLFEPDPVAEVVDTTAAGDSFNAGFLAAHLDRAPDRAAAEAGAKLAGKVIGGRGALVRAARDGT